MAKQRLTVYDKYGAEVDYDVSTEDVTLDNEGGKSLKTKLNELDDADEGNVKRVTFNGTAHDPDEQGNVSIEQAQADWNQVVESHPSYVKNKPNSIVNEVLYDQQSRKVKQRRNGVVEEVFTLPEGGSSVTVDPNLADSPNPIANAAVNAAVNSLQGAITTLQNTLNNLMNGASVTDAIDTFNEVINFLDDIDTDDPTLANQLLALNNAITALQTALAGKISGIKANGASTTLPVVNGIVELPPAGSTISPADTAPQMDGTATVGSSAKYAREDHVHPHDTSKLSKSDVSVETQGDGTVDINVKDDTYTINLNHTHDGMAKLVKCTEATLPQTLEDDTIYVQVDNLTTPTEIEALHIFGLEFTGGGGAAPGVPYLSSPGANISMGDTENGSVTKAIKVKGRYLTQALSATLTGTGYTFGATQPTGVTRNSDTSLTITADVAKAGVDVSVVYTGTAFNATGTLAITSSSPDNIDVESTLLANELDTDGLVAHWDAADAPSSGAWVDRINSMKLNLGGTAAHESDGYRLNNLSAPKNAWLYCDSSHISLLNSEIDKEFTCIIDCEVKFTAASKRAMIIDFGGFGTTTGGLAVNAKVNQAGTLGCGAKKGNTAITAQANDVQIPAFTLDTYIPIRMTCGIYVASNGTQVIYSKIGTAEAYSYNSPAVQVNLQGADLNYPFGAGIVYMTGNGLNYAADYLADVIYKSIIIYNKKV